MTLGLWSLKVEVLLIFLIVSLSVLLWYMGYNRHRRQLLEFYRSLGARQVGYKWFIFPIAELEADGTKIRIYTEGGRGLYTLKASLEIEPLGYLRLWRGWLLDRLLLRNQYLKGVFLEYEDKKWAENLLNREDFRATIKRLFELPGLSFFEIKGKSLSIGWHLGGTDRFKKVVDREGVLQALKIMIDLRSITGTLSSAKHYRENLRSWLTLKLPLLITLFLVVFGFVGGFYNYNPVCDHEILLAGFRIMIPIILTYTAFVLLLTGGPTLGQKVVLRTLFVCLACIPITSISFLTWVNGYFDRSEPELKKDTIARKYYLIRGGHRVVLVELHKNRWCRSFGVSEYFYMRAKVGDSVEYTVKKGFLGVNWFYRKLSLT